MLLSLATELQAHICSLQDHHNLTVLMRVNKSLSRLIEPMLYSQVELHPPGYHEYYAFPSEVDAIPSENRNYWTETSAYNPFERSQDIHAADKTDSFMKLFEDVDDGHPRARREALAKHVRLLCLEITIDNSDEYAADPLGILASFQNLTHLELTMSWPQHQIWDQVVRDFLAKNRPPLETLRKLRLRGYVPKEFVQYLCRGATGISDLELAVLDQPIGSILADDRMNPPPPKRKSAGDEGGDDEEEDDEDDAEEEDDAEDFDEECIAPRALAALGDINLAAQFSSLTRLRLCRPAESLSEPVQDTYVSVVSDVAILKEWAALIRATRGTLEHLVLDQRPFAEEIERVSTGDEEFLRAYAYGAGYDRFVEHALPALIEDGIEWPRLKSVDFHGFDVPPKDGDEDEDDGAVDKQQRLLEVVAGRFEPLGVDVRSGLGRRMVFEDDDGVIRGHVDGFGGWRWDLEDTD
ncbi:hypothetical protein C8R45DRAFT_1211258 [Mycena sanguinolenta]|nr:hypothetical protein C8R45DRAFT_1211258 [Mycena sanguinolenta]